MSEYVPLGFVQGGVFEPEDLVANRRGEFSSNQVSAMRSTLRTFVVIACGFVAVGVIAGWYTRTSNWACVRFVCRDPGRDLNDGVQFLLAAVPVSLLGLLLAGVAWSQYVRERAMTVEARSGVVIADTTFPDHPKKYLVVDEATRIHLSHLMVDWFEVGATYDVYHQGSRLLSFEWQPPRQGLSDPASEG